MGPARVVGVVQVLPPSGEEINPVYRAHVDASQVADE
jgi:hypothetical protein